MNEKILSKSFTANFLSAVISGIGCMNPMQPEPIQSIGFFAWSGAITNWLAIQWKP